MKIKSRFLASLGVVAIAAFVWMISALHSQANDNSTHQEVNEKIKHFPTVVCCARTDSEDEVRDNIGKLYEQKISLIEDRTSSGNLMTTFSHWNNALPAFPIARSNLIIQGKVTDARAYLTRDRTNVYSEFSIQVGLIHKNDPIITTYVGDTVVATRRGGRVRFSSGRTVSYVVHGQDMPRKNDEYIFFLEYKENQFTILTAYKLVNRKIHPLDGANAPVASRWRGDEYEGADLSEVLAELDGAIENGGFGQ